MVPWGEPPPPPAGLLRLYLPTTFESIDDPKNPCLDLIKLCAIFWKVCLALLVSNHLWGTMMASGLTLGCSARFQEVGLLVHCNPGEGPL